MQSIGERLEEARKRKGLSIREASEATKIRSDYLHKFESNQFDINLPEIYVKGFLRTYANFLKAPAEKIIADYMGLGHGDSRTRQINREVYGRMDLSVGSKMDKEPKEKKGSGTAAPEEVATNEDAAPRNPATFVPPRPEAAPRAPINIDLIIKIGGLVLAVVFVIIIGIWLLSGRGEKTASNKPNTAATSVDANWVRPQPGERMLVLVGNGQTNVTVTSKRDNSILFQGALSRGDRRELPRRGTLRIVSDQPQNLLLEIDGNQWPLKDPRTNQFLSSAEIPER